MTQYSIEELEQMLGDVESDLVERKESFKGDAPTTTRQAVCAFANDLPDHRRAGVVLIGACDDGTPANLPITDELLRQLADIKTDGNILPPPTITVSKQRLSGAEVAVITVEPSDSPPVRYKGRIHVRIGSRGGIATAQDERILNERRRYRDIPFDLHPINQATIDDLDRNRFRSEYLPAVVAPDVLQANQRSEEQQLAATKLIAPGAQGSPAVLGLLVIGKTPQDYLPGAYVQFLRIEGTELGEPIIDEERIDGTAAEIIRRLDEKLVAHNRTAVDYTSQAVEQRIPWYPIAALQQLTRNAILHRTYEHTHAPVRVNWFDDRIEIQNPGGPYGQVTTENFGTSGITDYRNPNLAEAMRGLGFVQRFGVGIPTAQRELGKNGNPPLEFLPQSGHMLVIVRRTL